MIASVLTLNEINTSSANYFMTITHSFLQKPFQTYKLFIPKIKRKGKQLNSDAAKTISGSKFIILQHASTFVRVNSAYESWGDSHWIYYFNAFALKNKS